MQEKYPKEIENERGRKAESGQAQRRTSRFRREKKEMRRKMTLG